MSDAPSKTRRLLTSALIVLAVVLTVRPAAAADQVYFSSQTNVTNILVQYINQETVRLDISSWYLSEHSISIAIANRFAAGVPVRLIGDRGAIFDADPHTKAEFYWLASQGIPIRLRYNPTWFTGRRPSSSGKTSWNSGPAITHPSNWRQTRHTTTTTTPRCSPATRSSLRRSR
jgi:hypothetical protein